MRVPVPSYQPGRSAMAPARRVARAGLFAVGTFFALREGVYLGKVLMVLVTPCQRVVSDRFPVASFVVNAPPQRLFEIACATDATLFRADQRHRRTPNNFYSTRIGGLMRAPAGQTTFLLPSDQLRRFAGARRLY